MYDLFVGPLDFLLDLLLDDFIVCSRVAGARRVLLVSKFLVLLIHYAFGFDLVVLTKFGGLLSFAGLVVLVVVMTCASSVYVSGQLGF